MPLDKEDVQLDTDSRDWWTMHRGSSPVLGTAIHNGHEVRREMAEQMALPGGERLREEDPFTEYTIRDFPNRVAFHRSRFAVDLNRARDKAVYLSPEQSWGLEVWDEPPSDDMVEKSLRMHDHYYIMLKTLLRELQEQYGRFVVFDIHSYNHRRDGPQAAPADPVEAPAINIGTISMDREKWAYVVDPLIEHLRTAKFRGQNLDVRENVAFEGRGEQTRFIHDNFPDTGCAIAIEFKKFFMDEWSGDPDVEALVELRQIMAGSLPVIEAILSGKD